MAQQEVVKDTQNASIPPLESIYFLYISVKSAKDLEKADLSGSSDPFCKVIANKQSWTTKTIKKNLNPEWNQNTQFVFFEAVKEIKFEVFDWDKGSKHDLIGTYTLKLDTTSFYNSDNNGVKGWKTLQNCKKGSIEIEVGGKKIKPLEMERRCKKLEIECKDQEENIERKKKEYNELNIEYKTLSDQRSKSEKEKVEYEDKLSKVQKQTVNEQKKIDFAMEEIEKFNEEIKKYKEKKIEYEKKLNKYQNEIEREEKKLKYEEKENDKLTEERDNYKEDVNKEY